jgi:hypothetical protein
MNALWRLHPALVLGLSNPTSGLWVAVVTRWLSLGPAESAA